MFDPRTVDDRRDSGAPAVTERDIQLEEPDGTHDASVKALSERIVRALGKALVVPVMAYVPERTHSLPTAHMRFPGTLTVPGNAFRQTLQSAAQSVRLHGFHDIVLLGDHGSAQPGENAVAARLNRKWTDCPARVHALDEFYRSATVGFRRVLKRRGYRLDELGAHHAAVPNTSRTLAIDPRLVRFAELCDARAPRETTGSLATPDAPAQSLAHSTSTSSSEEWSGRP